MVELLNVLKTKEEVSKYILEFWNDDIPISIKRNSVGYVITK